jgi:hypothetical protein
MLIGNNTADYGLTFFNGINPPNGGYTIYLNKASGGPSIYCPANNTQLIGITNQIAGANYTTAQQCFDYYNSQTDKVCVTQNYPTDFPFIVLDGLVLYLDAGVTLSYPGTGTTWTDVNGLGTINNGTLINGVGYSSANSGSIVFDGVDDQINATAINVGTNFTVNVWAKVTSTTRMILLSNAYLYTTNKGFLFNVGNNGTDLFLALGQDQQYRVSSNGYVSANTWFCASTTFDGTTIKLYYNGVETTYQATVGSISTLVYDANPLYLGKGTYDIFQGNIAISQMYNRALSAAEITQNYNAQKGRFGL